MGCEIMSIPVTKILRSYRMPCTTYVNKHEINVNINAQPNYVEFEEENILTPRRAMSDLNRQIGGSFSVA